MRTEKVTRHQSGTALALALAVAALTSGCSDNSNPPSGSVAYKSGALGNGSFLFACDDGAACLPYSGDAARFPEQIATGSNFDVRFVAKDEQGSYNKAQYDGITVQGVMPYLRRGPQGLTALKAGLGTLVAYDNAGNVVEYATVAIRQPTTLAVYDANSTLAAEKMPKHVESIDLKVGDMGSYRVLAEVDATTVSGGSALAGSIPFEWDSSDPAVITVDGYSAGAVNLVAKKAGETTLSIKCAALSRTINVKVQP